MVALEVELLWLLLREVVRQTPLFQGEVELLELVLFKERLNPLKREVRQLTSEEGNKNKGKIKIKQTTRKSELC